MTPRRLATFIVSLAALLSTAQTCPAHRRPVVKHAIDVQATTPDGAALAVTFTDDAVPGNGLEPWQPGGNSPLGQHSVFSAAGFSVCADAPGYTHNCVGISEFIDQPRTIVLEPVVNPVVRRSRAETLHVRALLANLFDGSTPIWGSSFPALYEQDRPRLDRWLKALAAEGATHVVTGAFDPGEAYPGMGLVNPDWTHRPDQVAALIASLTATAGADGKGFAVLVFLSGGPLPRSLVDDVWPGIIDALRPYHDQVIYVPCWECVQGDATARQLDYANGRIKALDPDAILFNHFSPGRAVGLGNPTEPDSPYRRWALAQCVNGVPVRDARGNVVYDLGRAFGDAAEAEKAATPVFCGLPGHWDVFEPDFWTLNNGPKVDGLLYQTDHGSGNYRDCNEDDDNADCFLNRWQDVVSRVGAGFHGWAKRIVVFFESCAYERFRNQVTNDACRLMATRAKRVADKWSVDIGYGNGLPAQ